MENLPFLIREKERELLFRSLTLRPLWVCNSGQAKPAPLGKHRELKAWEIRKLKSLSDRHERYTITKYLIYRYNMSEGILDQYVERLYAKVHETVPIWL